MNIEKQEIIDWALNYASYDELEEVSKALYALYAARRKQEKPIDYKKAKIARARYYKKKHPNKKQS